jgi:hypothetical protein
MVGALRGRGRAGLFDRFSRRHRLHQLTLDATVEQIVALRLRSLLCHLHH